MRRVAGLVVGLATAAGMVLTAQSAQAAPPTVTAAQCVAGGGQVVTVDGHRVCSGGEYDFYWVR